MDSQIDGLRHSCTSVALDPAVRWPSSELREIEKAVTILDDVASFVSRLAPSPVCDDCIADRLKLSLRQQANQKTRELAGRNGFERRKDTCSMCGDGKLVIRKSPR